MQVQCLRSNGQYLEATNLSHEQQKSVAKAEQHRQSAEALDAKGLSLEHKATQVQEQLNERRQNLAKLEVLLHQMRRGIQSASIVNAWTMQKQALLDLSDTAEADCAAKQNQVQYLPS